MTETLAWRRRASRPPARAVLARIAAAARGSGRDPADVTLVAVSKTVEPDRLRDAVAAGLTLLGENRVQEGAAKAPEVPGARWHLIGPLQSNKARRALEVYEPIQSVDSVALAERLDRLAREVRDAGPATATRSCSRSTSTTTRPRPASRPTSCRARWSACRRSTRSRSAGS